MTCRHKEEGKNALVGEAHVELVVERAQIGHNQVRIHASDLRAKLWHDLARIAPNAGVSGNSL